jgi:hypothetical protein
MEPTHETAITPDPACLGRRGRTSVPTAKKLQKLQLDPLSIPYAGLSSLQLGGV